MTQSTFLTPFSPIDHPRLTLGIILAFGLGLRCLMVQSRGITYDDAFSILLANRSWGEIVAGTAADTMPPLYYFLLHLWSGLGSSIGFLRSLNILFSLGAILVLFGIVRMLAGVQAGLWASLLAAISPLQIYHAQDLRMYAPLVLFEAGYVWFFLRIRERGSRPGKPADWIGLIACAALALYTHNLAAIGLAAPNLVLLAERRWKLLGKFFMAQAGIGILFIPWLVYLPGQIEKIQTAFWTPRPGPVEVVQSIVLLHSYLPLNPPWFYLAVLLSVMALVLVVFEGIKQVKIRPVPIGLSLLIIAPPVLLFLLSYLMRPVFVTRAFIYAAFFYLGSVGIVLANLKLPGVRYFLIGCMVLASGIALPALYTFDGFPRADFRSVVEIVSNRIPADGLVLHDNKLSYFPCQVLAPDLKQAFLPDEPGSMNDTLAPATQAALGITPAKDVETAVQDHSSVYFVVFRQAIQEYLDMGQAGHPTLSWLDQRYHRTEILEVGDLSVYVYQEGRE